MEDIDTEVDLEEIELDEAGTSIVSPDINPDSEQKVRFMAEAADAVRAEDLTVLDLRELTIIADFFLICTGKSSIQIRSIADRIEEKLRDHGLRKLRVEGYQEATWILLDYGDVVAHIMAAEQRAFYNIEAFWNQAPRMELNLTPEGSTLYKTPVRFDSLATHPYVLEYLDNDLDDDVEDDIVEDDIEEEIIEEEIEEIEEIEEPEGELDADELADDDSKEPEAKKSETER